MKTVEFSCGPIASITELSRLTGKELIQRTLKRRAAFIDWLEACENESEKEFESRQRSMIGAVDIVQHLKHELGERADRFGRMIESGITLSETEHHLWLQGVYSEATLDHVLRCLCKISEIREEVELRPVKTAAQFRRQLGAVTECAAPVPIHWIDPKLCG